MLYFTVNSNQIRSATCGSGLQDYDHVVLGGHRMFRMWDFQGDRSALRAMNEKENDS